MYVRIYRPAKTAMQSGRRNTHKWVLEFAPGGRRPEPLMGWTSSVDTRNQVRLSTELVQHGLMYQVLEPHEPKLRPKAYADNFAFDRCRPWTH